MTLAEELSKKYGRTVMPVSCVELTEETITEILKNVLFEFPLKEIAFSMPKWVTMLDHGHWLQEAVYTAVQEFAEMCIRDRDVEADFGEKEVSPRDILLLCSDGLSNCVSVPQIEETLARTPFYEAADALVQKALEGGGDVYKRQGVQRGRMAGKSVRLSGFPFGRRHLTHKVLSAANENLGGI